MRCRASCGFRKHFVRGEYMKKSALRFSEALILAALAISVLPSTSLAVHYGDFFGTTVFAYNQLSYDQPLWNSGLSNARRDLLWSKVEPTPGVYDDAYLQSFITGIAAPAEAQGVRFMPMLDYNTSWSYDTSARTYYDTADNLESGAYGHATKRYSVTPLGGDQYQYTVSTWTAYKDWWNPLTTKHKWVQSSSSAISGVTSEGLSNFPIATNQMAARADFLTHVVNSMSPYGVRYYQVWNEASQTSGYWHGGYDMLMQRIVLPDAATIHAAGGKVVYGGWPSDTSVQTFINVLNFYNAWGSLDVIDMHYHPLQDMETLRLAAVAAGHPTIGIWQSEYGYTTAKGTIGNVNPRFLNWALKNDGSADPNRYKMSWFGFQSVPGFAQGMCLYEDDGVTLSKHGICLQTQTRLLDGANLRLLNGVSNSRNWTASLDENTNSIESFVSDNGRVIALHTSLASGTVTLTIPGFNGLNLADLVVSRIDQSGFSEDLTGMYTLNGDNLIVTVNLADNSLSPVKSWDLGTSMNTFFVHATTVSLLATVPEPSTAAALLAGSGLMALGRRKRKMHCN